MKSILKRTGIVCIAFLLGWNGANAGELTHRRVEGQAKFELRHSLVTQNYCAFGPCNRSVPYWALVLHQREMAYELNQAFAEGNPTPPGYVELNGIRVRPGRWVSIEGLVDSVSNSLGVITEVHFVDVEIRDPGPRPRFPGWTCESSSSPQGFYKVNVWRVQDAEVYRLDVKLIHGLKSRDVTSLNHIQIARDGGDVHYYGADQYHRASLLIHQNGNPVFSSPGSLTLEQLHESPTNLDLKCTPLRSLPTCY